MYIRVLMENTAAAPSLACEHGLSLYIITGGKKILFDAGQTDAFAENAARLGVDLADVDLCILSHGHYDHSGGLKKFLEINDHAPVYMHRRAAEPHYNGSEKYIGIAEDLQRSSRVIFLDSDCAVGDSLRLCMCSGCAASHPDSTAGMTVKTDAGFVQDPFDHEQYLVIEENGRRIVVSGCSHRGVLNIADWLAPDVFIGGFHFMKLDPAGEGAAFLEEAAHTLLANGCTYYTGHCTGEAAYAFLKARMGGRLHALRAGYAYVL